MTEPISITALSSISPLGFSSEEIWNNYLEPNSFLKLKKLGETLFPAGFLNENAENEIEKISEENPQYKNLDKSVLLAIYASRKAIKEANWSAEDNFGVNIGSSRGATSLFEKHFEHFLKTKKTSALASPTTTLGNISSWVAQDLQTRGPEFSHSITCSTALHAVINAIAWLKAGMANKFLVGGSEAALTAFTIAQMNAMKAYSTALEPPFCEALNFQKKKNTMVISEAAAMACLELGEKENALAIIKGIGFATEVITHGASISANAEVFQRTMKDAIGDFSKEEIDAIVMHAPGTIKGDLAEFNAVKAVFGEDYPLLTSNKWKVGHSFGASGMVSLEMAVLMLKNEQFVASPFFPQNNKKGKLENIIVNAVGFGGNAVSILVSKSSAKN